MSWNMPVASARTLRFTEKLVDKKVDNAGLKWNSDGACTCESNELHQRSVVMCQITNTLDAVLCV